MSDINRIIAGWMGVRRDISGPHFDSDLDACAEAERKLTNEQHLKYRVTLQRIIGPQSSNRAMISATAPQRAAALAAVIQSHAKTQP